MRKFAFLTLPLACLLQACGGNGRVEPGLTITDEDRAYGAEAHPQLLAEFGGDYRGEEARYVAAVGERVAAAAGLGRQCTFTLANSDVVNAFAVPGCYIYVTRGLVAIVTSEAELASVLGHELGHIVARHAQRQERRSIWRTLGVIAVSVTGSERLTKLASQAAQYFGLRYSRTQEYEADDLGVDYLQRAGYDVYAAADMLSALQRQEAFMIATRSRDAARGVPEWALSHPLTEHRIDRAHDTAEKTGLKDDALPEKTAEYLAEVDGLLYGDDPEQGFVIGRRFAHPIMRISFEAPPGFSLTNSPQAIRLSGPDDLSGEFGGGAMPDGDLRSYADALAGHVIGDAPAEVTGATAATINGLPAIVMQIKVAVRDGAVPLAIAVYDAGDGQAYHFIIASPPTGGSAAVAALFQSFRRLSGEEAASLRPRFVRTVRAAAGDTSETLIRRIADPAPRALFELLNARSGDRPIAPGEVVKIVMYANRR
ncbi:MAG: M48 family metalloprotease [Sphingobium sp.]|uniref:M48 family metalloprotease n=1 Tax=Sphingobium sp. TaxID=1912891 RepID=UPI0029B98704|nr:M48 family metalloprotease [Sphingobium sp.]MDX3911224.1 M48 family metalloprotease [Sphingobium sp.]